MSLPLGPPLLSQLPTDTPASRSQTPSRSQLSPQVQLPSQEQLPLGLAPTGDFAFVRERVLKDALDKWDALTPLREIRLHQGRVWCPEAAQSDFGAGFLRPTPWATSQFCQRLGMPTAYFRRCPPALQDLQFNHWAGSQPETEMPSADSFGSEGGSGRWLLRAKGDVLRGVLSERYAPLDNDCLVECLAALLPKSFAVDWFELGDTSLHLRLVDSRHTRRVAAGDDIMVGCHIGNSEVGRKAVTVDALVYRLVCQNGLIRLVKGKSLLYQRHLSLSAPRFQEVLHGAILGALEAAAAFLDQLQEASRTPVLDVPATLALLARQESLSNSFLARMELSLKAEPASQQETVWGVINGLTQASKSLSADDRYAMETLAGRLIEEGLPQPPAAPVVTSLRDRRRLESSSAALEPTAGNGNETAEDETNRVETSERKDRNDGTDGRGDHDKWLVGKHATGNPLAGNPLAEHLSTGSRSFAN